MSQLKRLTVEVTTAADGSAVVKTEPINGFLASIRYKKIDFADTVDFDIYIGNASGPPVWQEDNITASTIRSPRSAIHDSDGQEVDGLKSPFAIVNEGFHIDIANGGNATSGVFEFIFAPLS